MASEFLFSRNLNAGATYVPPRTFVVQASEALIEVEVILPAAQKTSPDMRLVGTLLAAPPGSTNFVPMGLRFDWSGPQNIPPEVLDEYLARRIIFGGTLPPEGWNVSARLENLGTIRITADFAIRTVDGTRWQKIGDVIIPWRRNH